MKRIALFLLAVILILALCNFIPIPYSAARSFDSPLITPMRPTPTGWPHAPFAWQVTPQPREREIDNEDLSPGMRYWRWLIFRL